MARKQKPQVVHLDTHVVCWLYEGRVDLLSPRAVDAIEHARLVASPMVGLELQFLHEIGRIVKSAEAVLSALAKDIGLQLTSSKLVEVAETARDLAWTRDPFDRLIVAEAMLQNSPLLTRDRLITKHCKLAVW